MSVVVPVQKHGISSFLDALKHKSNMSELIKEVKTEEEA